MVKADITDPREAERSLLLLHAPRRARPAIAALLALDDRLAQLTASGHEPMLRRIRLAWWRDALAALDAARPPAEPLLIDLADRVLPAGVGGAALAAIASGWETLLDDLLDEAALQSFAERTGGGLFGMIATALGATDERAAAAGSGWALASLARRPGDSASRDLAMRMAIQRLDAVLASPWPRRLRILAVLAALARSDLGGAVANTPWRAAMMWRVRLRGC